MPAQSALSVGAPPPDRVPLGWLILLPLGALVLMQVLFAWLDVVPVHNDTLADTDAYTRLVRVLDLHATGDWFDSRLLRVNPPEGHVQHWTRPLDALLLCGAWLLEPVLGFHAGLHLWGVLISPVFLALALAALSWAAAPALGRDARLFACLVLLTQPSVLAYTSIGRPDHHSLLLLLCLILLGLTVRLALAPDDRRIAVLAGGVAALGVWISPEALVWLGVSLAALGLFWLGGAPGLARAQRVYLWATTFGLVIALGLERGRDLSAIEADRLSLVHVTLLGLLALFWTIVGARGAADLCARLATRASRTARRHPRAFQEPGRPARIAPGIASRALVATIGVVLIGGLMAILFPGLRAGPLGRVDPLYAQIRLANILEIQPLIDAQWLAAGRYGQMIGQAIKVLGLALVALPFLVLLLIRSRGAGRRFWVVVAIALAVYLPLAAAEVRWAIYAEALLAWPYAAAVAWLVGRLSAGIRIAPHWWRPPLLGTALLWPLLVAAGLPQREIDIASDACPLDRLAPLLQQASAEPRTILAYADYGAELLYRTRHRVLSIPNHRFQPGFTATYRILTATDDASARALLARSGVDWILLCPSPTERAVFAPGQASAPTLYRRLVAGEVPDWLQPLPLGPELERTARLYEVRALPNLVATPAGR